ncbi:protein VAPYRIN-like [Pyrus communis]|uniref:protein VAPYRIN-like n=1 Tax=Pyrus communis TaxID=23211 RepID=UPI0035C0DC91
MDAKDEDGYTTVQRSRDPDVIEMLVKKIADAKARTNKGVTALQIAESLHYVGITRILIHRGVAKDNSNMAHILTHALVSFRKISMGLEKEVIKGGMKKKKSSRARALRGSFNRSMSLAVV